MKKFTARMVLLSVIMLGVGFRAELTNGVQAQNIGIDSIGGYNSGGVVNGRWTGQPSNAPSTASNKYRGFLAIDTWTWDNTSSSTWAINGRGFGGTRGTVSVGFGGGIAGPLPFSIVTILSWTNTQIQVRVAGLWTVGAYTNISIAVRTAGGVVTSRTENIVAAPKGRGYGQCTWEVFYQRKNAGLTPPPTAYPSATAINANYIPRQWDVLFWDTRHTAIITSIPQVVRSSDGTISYRFTLTERNATWNEAVSTRSSELSVKNGVVTQGILSNISSTSKATGFWR